MEAESSGVKSNEAWDPNSIRRYSHSCWVDGSLGIRMAFGNYYVVDVFVSQLWRSTINHIQETDTIRFNSTAAKVPSTMWIWATSGDDAAQLDSKSGLCATVMSRKKVHLFSQFCFILITVGLRTVRLQQVSGQADKVQLNQVIRYKIWTE